MRNHIVVAILFLSSLSLSAQVTQAQYEEIHGNGNYSSQDRSLANRKARVFQNDVTDIDALAQKTDAAIDGILHIAYLNLKRNGFDDEAKQIRSEWMNDHKGEIERIISSRLYRGTWDIGDFAPLSKWLDSVETKVETLLGYQLAFALRVTDLKTLNFGIPVVFNPCKYGMTEFECAFCGDSHCDNADTHPYRGVVPVVAYWAVAITCDIATYGAGYFFICSPIAQLVSWDVDKYIAPKLFTPIFNDVCGGKQ